ncbi:MAG: RES family NAD+ phosphorylase [Betaproteobacteria bacterium]|nr:RES family NAD+ phosphorylase [Betaproteobacteria bacterium]
MTCRPPVPPLDPLFDEWHAGEPIHTLYSTNHAPEHFNSGFNKSGNPGNPTRFAPIRDEHGRIVPYLYGGSSRDCAIFETVFHNVPFDAPHKFVDLDDFASRGYARLIPQRTLRLVDLTTEGLHRLRVPKEELVTSPSRDYPDTARWAEALHRQCRDVDGLIWMSRQRDRDRALVLFGDRVGGKLIGLPDGGALRNNERLRQAIINLALRAGIVVA